MRYKIWNGKDTLATPSGALLTAEEILAKYPAAGREGAKYIICDSNVEMGVFMELETAKDTYKRIGVKITEQMSDQEVLEAISLFEEMPPVREPSAEERIAAQLEFQSLMMI